MTKTGSTHSISLNKLVLGISILYDMFAKRSNSNQQNYCIALFLNRTLKQRDCPVKKVTSQFRTFDQILQLLYLFIVHYLKFVPRCFTIGSYHVLTIQQTIFSSFISKRKLVVSWMYVLQNLATFVFLIFRYLLHNNLLFKSGFNKSGDELLC